ncbi:hypothetical protein S2091_4165 [Solimicrobium silvestre]|uniref:Uncharacterized protein n=1 Tax=Solimicrobium silvestre TaxID=2099400 RepID=A0A2S9GTY1_9BURK|nr:hypothetical protein S2091_4165 [Solimicrobium silvestre]
MRATVPKIVTYGAVGLFGLIVASIAHRLNVVSEAAQNTTEFCQSVKPGDDVSFIMKKVGHGESGVQFNTIYEQREGQPTWPRHVIWNGPHYKRVYCSLEIGSHGDVLATHIGPIDEKTPGFFEDWIGL